MELSRKTQKNLKRLKNDAGALWEQQQKVMEQAGQVVADARKKLSAINEAEIKPRVDSALAQVRPNVDRGVAYAQATATVAKDKIVSDILPAVSSALGSAISMVELAKDPRVREALKQGRKVASATAARVGTQAGKVAKASGKAAAEAAKAASKQSSGKGKFFLITLGITAIVGVGWAAYQALRADDDLWLEDIED